MARASEGYFVRDPERNLVYCPAGQILRQKCIKKSGDIRYANKFACRRCPHRNKCYKGKNEWKEIDFNKDTLEKPCRDWLKAEGKEPVAERRASKGVFEKIKVVILKLRPDREKMSQLSVNLSRKDFTHDNLVKAIDRVSRKYGIPREFTHVELTESAFVENIRHVNQHIEAFHKRGYQVWMDDFGSGYSSLGVLQKYSFDVIKIDMDFLRNFNSKSQMIITAIVKMAKEIGIQTLAEGVEAEQQFSFLKSIGCEKIQGYYFAKPMPLEETIPFFKTRGLELERAKWTGYFDALSRIDYLTDQSLCVVDDDGTCLKFLYCNNKYREVLKRDHVDDLRDWETRINTPGGPICIFHRRFADQQLRKLSGTQSIAYPSGDHYMQRTASVAVSNVFLPLSECKK